MSDARWAAAWPLCRMPEAATEIWEEVERADRLLREPGRRLEGAAAPVRSPFRCLVLAQVGRMTAFGVSPGRLARRLGVSPPHLAYHLDLLEEAKLVWRERGRYPDERKVRVRLTRAGAEALAWAAAVVTPRLLDGEAPIAGEPRDGAAPIAEEPRDSPAPVAQAAVEASTAAREAAPPARIS